MFATSKAMDRIAFTQDFLDYVEQDKDGKGHELVYTSAEQGHFIVSGQCPRARARMVSFLSKHGGP